MPPNIICCPEFEAPEGCFEVQNEGVDDRMLNWWIDKPHSDIPELHQPDNYEQESRPCSWFVADWQPVKVRTNSIRNVKMGIQGYNMAVLFCDDNL